MAMEKRTQQDKKYSSFIISINSSKECFLSRGCALRPPGSMENASAHIAAG